MLYSVKSNKPHFKTIQFKEGLNVVLADRTSQATKKDSRNGQGKSTLVEIIHFCLGSNKGDTLKKVEMADWEFTIELDVCQSKLIVTRSVATQKNVYLQGDFSKWPIQPTFDKKTNKHFMSVENYKSVLGNLLFGLDIDFQDTYHPTFRSLISYFIRLSDSAGSFHDPFDNSKKQQEWDKQINNAYLLGLDWKLLEARQLLKDEDNTLDELKKGLKLGVFDDIIGKSQGELETTKIRLEEIVNEEKRKITEFKILEQYHDIEVEANELTKRFRQLSNTIIQDTALLQDYQSSLSKEVDASPQKVSEVYSKAGLVFPKEIVTRLDDVLEFHKKITENRKLFLQTEMLKLKRTIDSNEKERQTVSDRKENLLKILKNHGALDELNKLQELHQINVSKFEEVKLKLKNLQKIEDGKSNIKIRGEELKKQIQIRLEENKLHKEEAILLFNKNSEELYNAPGNLVIELADKGLKFGVNILKSGSQGIDKMKIFCYDLMLAQLWAKRNPSPHLLLHDSTLFDGVDERQIALALELAAQKSKLMGFQYIITLNSDLVPKNDFSPEFKFEDFVVMKLGDKEKDSGLLGIRF